MGHASVYVTIAQAKQHIQTMAPAINGGLPVHAIAAAAPPHAAKQKTIVVRPDIMAVHQTVHPDAHNAQHGRVFTQIPDARHWRVAPAVPAKPM